MISPDNTLSSNLKQAEAIAELLSEAISSGDKEDAKKFSEQLSDFGFPVSVKLNRKAYSLEYIRLKVGVADVHSDTFIPITLLVTPDMTISDLKEKIKEDYAFDPVLQNWVIGKRLAQDSDSLYSYGVYRDEDQAYLYIKSAQAASLGQKQQKWDANKNPIVEIADIRVEARGNAVAEELEPKPADLPMPQVGWTCPECTYLNKPTRPGCEMCCAERPQDYHVPDIYLPDEEESNRLQQEKIASLQYQQALDEERERNLQSLLETDTHSLVPNPVEEDCPICFNTISPGEGATLRECLHSFCNECLKHTILNSLDAEVTCPYADLNYICDLKLQDREIRSLLSPEEYKKFLEKRLSIAENRIENSFHCKTPDCAGWCVFEDDVNEFDCPRCHQTNCLLCKAIHRDMNCKEYQDDLRIRAENDTAAKQTTEMLQALLMNGEAMHCPKCKVVVQKKDGCDWICCLMCKTEICWVTRQARWGPKGSGDTSGGCRCRVAGLCHPNCQNCH